MHHPEDPVPEDLLVTCDPVLLNTHLLKFAVEARKANGENYPPGTIHQLLCGLLRHMRETTPGCPNFLNKQDSQFRHLQGTLDALFHKLCSSGIGVQVRHTEIITKADEDKQWATGVMGISNPTSLQNAALFVVGKMFSLRGGVEHQNFKISQLKRNHDPDHIYQENVSKTNSGSFKKLHIKGKVVPIYRICSNIGATLIQVPFETYTIFSVLIRGTFADGNYFQAVPILIRMDIAMCDIANRY